MKRRSVLLALLSVFLALPAWAQTWERINVPPRPVYQPYLTGNQSIPQGQPGAAESVCPRQIMIDGTIFRSFSGATAHDGIYYSFGGGHAGHPGNDLDLFDIVERVWLPQPYEAECPPPYKPDGTPNGTWRSVKGGATATQGLSPTGKPWVHHTYRNTTMDTRRNRLVFVSGNGLMTWAHAQSWRPLAGRDRNGNEVTFGSTGSLVYDKDSDSVYLFASDTANGASRGVHKYTFAPDGTVATKQHLHAWPTLANWSFATKYVTAIRGAGRIVWLIFAPVTPSTNVPRIRLFRYDLDTGVLTWDQTLVPGTAAYDHLFARGSSGRNVDRRTPTNELYFWTGTAPAGLWIKSEASGAWRFEATPNGPPGIAAWGFAYDARTDSFVGLASRNIYCGITASACGGIADTWVLTP